MKITTNNIALKELLQDGKTKDKRYKSLPKGVIKGFIKACAIISNARSIEDVMRYPLLHYERLKGNLSAYESVRCNDQYRLIFISSADENEIIITNVELLNISNHYGDL